MSAPQPSPPWTVTYLNPVTGKRHVLIDDIDDTTADAVMRKFGDQGDEFHRLPGLRKESAALAHATGGAA